jgi:hypothetical protein
MKFSCTVTNDGFHLRISAHDGSYPAWWKEIRTELYGWTPKQNQASLNGSGQPLSIEHPAPATVFTFPDDGKGSEVELR